MLNHIVLMGRLVRDPELRRTQSGVPVVSFSLAVDHDIPNKETGERGVDFIDIVAWRQTAEFVSRFFTKGRMAVVSGRLQIRNWTDNTGNKRRAAEVVADNVYFGDSKRDNDNSGSYNGNSYGGGNNAYSNRSYNDNSYAAPNGGYSAPAAPAAPTASDFAMLEEDDSELPF
ncbi:MAG: single-stranded DNA-binding protein [Oscillospiraceae bacterium]|nr:single-stranded DNA-binding protein [Oscillospiraceae bacterium]